tara:strand:+ start:577 stop:1011 length:435 start_codon:yes stop_codon:yes gene_type:complete
MSVRGKYDSLLSSPVFRIAQLPKDLPEAGIYIISKHSKVLYVGRSNCIRKRLQYHTRNNHNQATFAFLLARYETGNLKASYKPEGSRKQLLENAVFREAFDKAREDIRKMDVQVVEENDPVNQAILEIFTAHKTKAKYNNFDNH